MKHFPTAVDQQTTRILNDDFSDDERAAYNDLLAKGYEVHYGLTRQYAEQIMKLALEPGIKQYCPNDCGKRFKDQDSIDRWLAKGRCTFLLLNRKANGGNTLVGYGWSGHSTSSKVPGGEITFAIRVAQAGQGQGLATPFARLILATTRDVFGGKNFWLETWQSNAGAVHIYQKLGFQEVHKQPDQRPTADNKHVPDTRLYMTVKS